MTGNVFPGARTIGIDLGQGVARDNTLLEATGAYSISIRGARESESVCRDNQTIAGATECAATDNVESLWHM